ncbi:hypothetical protein EZV73_19660 [Acidaminobacter sp. JC074]|uniref:tetratricopeptide repeat protein n=1 Tax=Acidaminobacter sp. JC074 TaxID=2530199 RepID=UPI001F11250F|nr:hypothetical protein [Acidaminobacter sp. JC074]MCH4889810.1 hypothetical protein [Acidaminobacter sp. JC074]
MKDSDWNNVLTLESQKKWKDAISILCNEYDSLFKSKDFNKLEKLAWCYSCDRDYDSAINVLVDMISLWPNNAKLHYTLGHQHYQKKNWKNAINEFREAISIHKDYYSAKYKLGYSLENSVQFVNYNSSLYNEIMNLYNDVILYLESKHVLDDKEKTKLARSHYRVGKLMLHNSRYRNAYDSLKKSNELKPDKDTSYSLAKVCIENNKIEEADLLLKELKNHSNINHLKVLFYSKINDEQALDYIDKLRKPYKHILKMELLIQFGRNKQAILYAKKNKRLVDKKSLHKYYYTLAIALYNVGLYKYTKGTLKKAIDIKYEKYHSSYPEASTFLKDLEREFADLIIIEDEELKLNELISIVNNEKEKKVVKDINENEIINLHKDKGFGFIKHHSGNYYFSIKNVLFDLNYLNEGMSVKYKVRKSKKKSNSYEAYDIEKVGDCDV